MNTIINRIRTWWDNNYYQVEQNVVDGVGRFCDGVENLARNIVRWMIIGIILNVIAKYFYPDFPERFPTIYGWFDGCIEFGEFMFKVALRGIYSIFTGHWSEFWTDYTETVQNLLQQFTNWITTIHF